MHWTWRLEIGERAWQASVLAEPVRVLGVKAEDLAPFWARLIWEAHTDCECAVLRAFEKIGGSR